MREVEATGELSALIDLAGEGEELIIARRGERVARLVREPAGHDREKARRAAEAIVEMSKGASLGGLKIKDLINEGRR